MSEPRLLSAKETEIFRKNFVEKLREPMRTDFLRVVATITGLRTTLDTTMERLTKEISELEQHDAVSTLTPFSRGRLNGLLFARNNILDFE